MSTVNNQESLDKIISNIKSAIKNQEKGFNAKIEDHSVIELTEVVTDESLINGKSAEEVSGYIKDISNQVISDQDDSHILSDEEIKEVFKDVLKPYLQSWLNNNLSKIVKEVVEKEVRHLFDKAKT
jgi:cell pole-organizing protein PopZ